jgi:methionyl aminopeptidase
MGIIVKSKNELSLMRQAGKIVADTIALLTEAIRPGVKTIELDEIAFRYITGQGAIPSFKGYNGFPASICASINNEVVHGIPDGRVLYEGDIISLDVGAIYKGWQGDSAVTAGVGQISEQAQRLLDACEGSLAAGIAQARKNNRLSDISNAVQRYAEERGFSVVRDYVGHGIGRAMHEDPQVPNFGEPGFGPLLKKGMTLALEPMVNAGGYRVKVMPDHWTVVTEDGSLSAHFEHTVAVTDGDPEILTRR